MGRLATTAPTAPLAALIIVDESDGDAGNTGAFAETIAGTTVFERQVRQAVLSGAKHIVAFVRTVPAALVAALDRLRDAGIGIDIARTARDAADRFHPDERVLLFSGPVVTSGWLPDAVRDEGAASIFVLPDLPEHEQFERVDKLHRWPGIAVVAGSSVRMTAAMIGDWSFGPTLMRRALQDGAALRDLGADRVFRVSEDLPAAAIAQQLTGGEPPPADSLVAMLLRPLIAPVSRRLAGLKTSIFLLDIVPIILIILSLGLALYGWPAAGFAGLLLADGVAVLVGRQAELALAEARVSALAGRWTSAVLALVLAIATFWTWQATGPGVATLLGLWLLVSWLLLLHVRSRLGARPDEPHLGAADVALLLAMAMPFGYPSVAFSAVLLLVMAAQVRDQMRITAA
jgi:hypothetical protein